MGDGSLIKWTDATWNVITGCSVVSPACTNCYAMRLAGEDPKLRNHPSRVGLTKETKAGAVWTGETRFNPQWLEQPLHWNRPRKVFVVAHGDLFHDANENRWLDLIFAVMAMAKPCHVFQILTKRPEGMRAYLETLPHRAEEIARHIMAHWPAMEPDQVRAVVVRLARWRDDPLPNVWLGVTAENQEWANKRVAELLACVAGLHWVSYEPALGPVDWRRLDPLLPMHRDAGFKLDALAGAIVREDGGVVTVANGKLDWLVAGGESGRDARPSHPDWYRQARDQCAATGCTFFFKQWGSWAHKPLPDGSAIEIPAPNDPKRRAVGIDGGHSLKSPMAFMVKTSKRAAGNTLDGQIHEDFPKVALPGLGS